MERFHQNTPTLDNYWRAIILFGNNTASYKFALGKSLLEVSNQSSDLIRIEDLAPVYAAKICEHLSHSPKQTTNPTSKFLGACSKFNSGEISEAKLVDETLSTGFRYVLDAFHIVGRSPIPIKFFIDDRKNSNGIRLTEEIMQLRELNQFVNLPFELEARWKLVEKAWELNMPDNVLTIDHDYETETFIASTNRRPVISKSRYALNGYQKGHCFYCSDSLDVKELEVDHFIPRDKSEVLHRNLDRVWNLVLSCNPCNGPQGKWHDKLPNINSLERLYDRNEYYINSHHPLRETLIQQTGYSKDKRKRFINSVWNEAKQYMFETFDPNMKSGLIL